MKSDEEIMEILEAFDLTRSFRDAGGLAGCSPNTVAHWVGARDGGTLEVPDDPEQHVVSGRLVLTYLAVSVVVGGLLLAGRAIGIEHLVIVVTGLVALVLLLFYVMWRRRRNKRLTGSPSVWPSE